MFGKPINSERKACDAVARSLEAIKGTMRTSAHSPEDNKVGPLVEYVFNLGDQKYAVEHTIVEAFDDQIHTGVEFGNFVAPISDALDHHMPSPGRYRLAFPLHPSKGLKSKNIPKVQASIIEWVKTSAAELHSECPEQPPKAYKPRGHTNFRKDTVASVDLLLNRETGWWVPDKAKGRLLCARFAPKDYEVLRLERQEGDEQEASEIGALEGSRCPFCARARKRRHDPFQPRCHP